MTGTRGWEPGSAPATAKELSAILAQHPVVVFHFWAIWNGVDRLFEPEYRTLRDEFADRVTFRSVDVDDPELQGFCRECGMANVPTLAGFVNGTRIDTLVGRRSIPALRRWIDRLIATADEAPD